MSIEILSDPTHKAVVISYDKKKVKGKTIGVHAENSKTHDVGTRYGFNTGTVVLFYPESFAGSSSVTVKGSAGGQDTG